MVKLRRPVQRQLLEDGLKTAHVAPVHAKDIVTEPCQLRSFDLTSMTPQEADFTADFTLQVHLWAVPYQRGRQQAK